MTRKQERTIMIAIWLLTLLFGVFFFTTRTEGSEGGERSELFSIEERVELLEAKVDILSVALQANLIGDCWHENILRDMFGEPPADVSECTTERIAWYADYYGIDIDVSTPPRL